MRRLMVVLALLAAAAVLSTGCGTRKQTVTTPGGKVTVETKRSGRGDKTTWTAETKEGKTTVTGGEEKTITEAELGVPVYPGAKVNIESRVETRTPGAGSGYEHRVLYTPDSYDKVVEFYKKNLKNIKNESSASSGDTKLTMFQIGEGKDQMMVHVTWDAKENRTMIQVIKGGM